MAVAGLLRGNPAPTDQDIAKVLDRNVCRCGTYPRIVHAIKLAAARLKSSEGAAADGAAMSASRSKSTIEVERYELSRPPSYRFEIERRDFMRIFGVLGGGLLVASVPDAGARRSPAAAARAAAPNDVAAWIHVDAAGRDHRVYGQDRDRPEHQDLARAGDRRRAARADAGGRAGHGRHRSGAVRSGHVRVALDAADGAGAGPRGGHRARDADRSSGGASGRWTVRR